MFILASSELGGAGGIPAAIRRVESIKTIQPNTWYFVVMNVNSTKVALFINGELDNESSSGLPRIASSINIPTIIGNNNYPNHVYANPLQGSVDDLRIYNRALSDSEILELYNEGKNVDFSNFTFIDFKIEFKETINDDKLKAEGEFTLNDASDGIDPLNEDVVVVLNNFSLTIPAGSFIEEEYGEFKFEGIINNTANAKMEIKTTGVNTFKFEVEAEGIDLTGTANPVNTIFMVGDDIGEVSVRFEGELKYEWED